MKYFGSISGCGLVLKQASKQASKNLKIPVPREGLAESGILKKAFWGLKPLRGFSKEIILMRFAGVCTIITQRIEKAHQKPTEDGTCLATSQ